MKKTTGILFNNFGVLCILISERKKGIALGKTHFNSFTFEYKKERLCINEYFGLKDLMMYRKFIHDCVIK